MPNLRSKEINSIIIPNILEFPDEKNLVHKIAIIFFFLHFSHSITHGANIEMQSKIGEIFLLYSQI